MTLAAASARGICSCAININIIYLRLHFCCVYQVYLRTTYLVRRLLTNNLIIAEMGRYTGIIRTAAAAAAVCFCCLSCSSWLVPRYIMTTTNESTPQIRTYSPSTKTAVYLYTQQHTGIRVFLYTSTRSLERRGAKNNCCAANTEAISLSFLRTQRSLAISSLPFSLRTSAKAVFGSR